MRALPLISFEMCYIPWGIMPGTWYLVPGAHSTGNITAVSTSVRSQSYFSGLHALSPLVTLGTVIVLVVYYNYLICILFWRRACTSKSKNIRIFAIPFPLLHTCNVILEWYARNLVYPGIRSRGVVVPHNTGCAVCSFDIIQHTTFRCWFFILHWGARWARFLGGRMKLVNIYSGVLVYFFGFGETKSQFLRL